MHEYEKNCTLIVPPIVGGSPPSSNELQKRLENPDDMEKCRALQELIIWMIHGEAYKRLLMTVIRYVVQSTSHKVKKYLQLYWEIVEKCDNDGNLKEEMILVCNALRNDLQHPNEYIRGSTLRLLCNLRFLKIIQPLIEAILANLGNRHSYVRRNAVMCIYSIIRTFGIELIPHATDEIEKLLLIEGDVSTKRNAFLVLTNCDVDRSLRYILSIQDNIPYMGDFVQMVLLELFRKIYRGYPHHRNTLLQLIVNIVQYGSPAIAFEGANTLITIGYSTSTNSIKTAIQAYINLLLTHSDNNVKFMILSRLSQITHLTSVLYLLQQYFILDILRVLLCTTSQSILIKILDMILSSLLTKDNCMETFNFLMKHLQTINSSFSNSSTQSEVRQLQQSQLTVLRSLHSITRKYPQITSQQLFEVSISYLGNNDAIFVNEVMQFLREMVISHPNLHSEITQKLLCQLVYIQFSKPIRTCLWIISEYKGHDKESIQKIVDMIYKLLIPLPLHIKCNHRTDESKIEKIENNSNVVTKTIILEDGSYATQDIINHSIENTSKIDNINNFNIDNESYLRKLITNDNDLLLIACLGVSLIKIILIPTYNNNEINLPIHTYNQALYMIVCFLKYSINEKSSGGYMNDTTRRLRQCLHTIKSIYNNIESGGSNEPTSNIIKLRDELFSTGDNLNFDNSSQTISQIGDEYEVQHEPIKVRQPFTTLNFRQLKEKVMLSGYDLLQVEDDIDQYEDPFKICTKNPNNTDIIDCNSLKRIYPITGLDDPVYIEVIVQVQQHDVLLELIIMNRANTALQNIQIEIYPYGNLQIVEKPQNINHLDPSEVVHLYSTVQVQSIETGILFGFVTFQLKPSGNSQLNTNIYSNDTVVLNEINIDLIDFISCKTIPPSLFRQLWAEFEWENKIPIHTFCTSFVHFLKFIMSQTKLSLIGVNPNDINDTDSYINKMSENSSFFAANLYSKSIFGEDALVNISLEKQHTSNNSNENKTIIGTVRIRSRTQGIALSLGDRIVSIQRKIPSDTSNFNCNQLLNINFIEIL
ncbi:coatomer beta subunit protein, putative [Cryptosporidium muris RN66]|uniref:Coatomer subunit beta n=1 Tax=Cryptosporidium muris (strain RN66) TaxID=441375 RepID=B6ABN2_CRYMR|nr:coatomer beta subunit protein, putative [Cryptosporidium muris RN66]EEA05784.1 coatomer beta subunit protein, putative [Cryptosporidium muris RN66]|eukprot:XP_002140133.1 coatomer beta subunit protein [Cryptosporidium muris RN66]